MVPEGSHVGFGWLSLSKNFGFIGSLGCWFVASELILIDDFLIS